MNDQEILEALKKSVAMPPVLCMNERSVIFVDYADGHGEAKTQVNNWFRCPCCSSIVGERRIVAKRVVDQRKKDVIKSGDQDAIERLEEKLVSLKETQERMKVANKAIRLKDAEKGDSTFVKVGDKIWKYCGNCFPGESVDIESEDKR